MCVCMCIKNIFTTAGNCSSQLQYSIWVSAHLLVCAYVCVWKEWGGSGGVQVIYILACSVSVNGAASVCVRVCVRQW